MFARTATREPRECAEETPAIRERRRMNGTKSVYDASTVMI